VQVTLICPGFIKTNVSLNAITGDGGSHGLMDDGQLRGMAPEECARQVWAAVAAGQEEAFIGTKEALFVRLKRHFPSLMSYAIKRAKVT
jgi:dehydrogenase/reductase SDR family member 7B